MKYFLWIDGKQTGSFELNQINEMLNSSEISPATLAAPEDGSDEWKPISSFHNCAKPAPRLSSKPQASFTSRKAEVDGNAGSILRFWREAAIVMLLIFSSYNFYENKQTVNALKNSINSISKNVDSFQSDLHSVQSDLTPARPRGLARNSLVRNPGSLADRVKSLESTMDELELKVKSVESDVSSIQMKTRN